MKLTLYDLEYIIKKFEPMTPEQFADFGLKLKSIGSGAFRRTYEIVGYDLVVKIPLAYRDWNGTSYSLNLSQDNVAHSKTEWNAYRSIKKKKKYKALRPFLSKIYSCSKKGIILMKKYKSHNRRKRQFKPILKDIQHVLDNVMSGDWCDIHWFNVAVTNKERLVIIDFGCFPDDL